MIGKVSIVFVLLGALTAVHGRFSRILEPLKTGDPTAMIDTVMQNPDLTNFVMTEEWVAQRAHHMAKRFTPEYLATEEHERLASIAFMEKRAAAVEKKNQERAAAGIESTPHPAANCVSNPTPLPAAPASTGKLTVTLKSLKCIAGNEIGFFDGEDEVKIEVWADGKQVGTMQNNDLNKGELWNLGKTFTGSQEIKATVTELDLTGDDRLGSLVFTKTAPAASSGTIKIKHDDANYDIQYQKSWAAGGVPAWKTALAAWASDSTGSVWKGITKAQVVASVTARLNNAMLINQRDTPLCGPAAILFEFVKRAPEYYVKMMRALTSAGTWTSPFGLKTKASTTLRNGGKRPSMDPADWIAMASMRETENAVFKVDQSSNAFVMGVTTPWEMKKWIAGMFGMDADFDSTLVWGEQDAIEKTAKTVANKGGLGFFLVDSAIMGTASSFHYPNHWIVYRCCLSITGDGSWGKEYNIGFKVWTWGQDCQIKTKEEAFEDAFFGAVMGHH